MTDDALLTLIRGNADYRALADVGHDDALAQAVNATLPAATPITVAALAKAAPLTFEGVGAQGLTSLEVIAARIRAGDAAGIGGWADALLLLKAMPDAEHIAVQTLVVRALTQDTVDHAMVSRVLNAIRPVEDGAVRAKAITWE